MLQGHKLHRIPLSVCKCNVIRGHKTNAAQTCGIGFRTTRHVHLETTCKLLKNCNMT